ncbi:MAG: hypothetical protein OEW15_18960, partial [Nitrospirota bacterium]|nr:hypothetical protein [Nitrospirota bacterium]
EYEKELKDTWQLLKAKVFKIAKLDAVTKDADTFIFTDEQRKQILDALKEYLGWYTPGAEDSNVNWYYGQSYSLGLIQAAELLGKERPILDILKNEEIFTELITDGFRLVKDNATRAIRDDIIMAMEQGVVDGISPRDVASALEELFSEKNSDWERLARTEMSGAAERAKLDEWDERGIDTSSAVTVPVHPRCRCSHSVQDDGKGKFRVVFAPAPDACPLCLSMQEGDKSVRRGKICDSHKDAALLADHWKGLELSSFHFSRW